MTLASLLRRGLRPGPAALILGAMLSSTAAAQHHRHLLPGMRGSEQRPGARGGVESEQHWNLAVNFASERSNTVSGVYGNFWLTGIGGNLYYNLWHGIGPVVDLYFMRAPNIAPNVDLNEYTYVGGLRYTTGTGSESSAPRRLQIFAEGLAGKVQAFNGVFPGGNSGVVKNADSLEVEAGGGIDWRVGRKIGFRVVQAHYVQTWLPNGQLNEQRNLRISGGFSAHF